MLNNKVKVIVFDLDDTLYSELDYVRSGLCFVASNLSSRFKLNYNYFLDLLLDSLKVSRNEIFNRVLFQLDLLNSHNLKQCIRLYRQHTPNIKLYPKTMSVLSELSQAYSIYIVTDGNKLVQEKKLRALGLYDTPLIKKPFITYRYGIKNSKPSPYCFNKISELESVDTASIVYIADNPKKDFIGIKPLGYQTVRVLTGQHKNCNYDDEYEAEHIIDKLADILTLIK